MKKLRRIYRALVIESLALLGLLILVGVTIAPDQVAKILQSVSVPVDSPTATVTPSDP